MGSVAFSCKQMRPMNFRLTLPAGSWILRAPPGMALLHTHDRRSLVMILELGKATTETKSFGPVAPPDNQSILAEFNS